MKNHHIYTDKFVLNVVDLKQIEMATEEDRQWEIDYWAALFKATTWEEVKMLAEQNPVFEDAVKTMYEMSAEDEIREQCRAREDYYRTMDMYKVYIQNRDRKIEQQASRIDELESEKSEQAVKIDQLEGELQRLKAQLESSQKME